MAWRCAGKKKKNPKKRAQESGLPESPQDILCLRCGAKPGVMCRTRRGNVAAYWHGRRNDDWVFVVEKAKKQARKNPWLPSFLRGADTERWKMPKLPPGTIQ